jgi:hypothetical protein
MVPGISHAVSLSIALAAPQVVPTMIPMGAGHS